MASTVTSVRCRSELITGWKMGDHERVEGKTSICRRCMYYYNMKFTGRASQPGETFEVSRCLLVDNSLNLSLFCVGECTMFKDRDAGSTEHLRNVILKQGRGRPTQFLWDEIFLLAELQSGRG